VKKKYWLGNESNLAQQHKRKTVKEKMKKAEEQRKFIKKVPFT
jgi:hypothetical protein